MAATTEVENKREVEEDLEKGEKINEEINEKLSKSIATTTTTTHPLEHAWTFWFHHPSAKSKKATRGSSMSPIYTLSTVEEIWSLFNNIPHSSKLGLGANILCFKNKIEPKWEDPICANGGKWTVRFSRGKSETPWLYTLLAMIGEQFDHGDEICGAVVSARAREEKISLWTKNAANEAAQLSIGKQWKKFLDHYENIGFIFHDDAKKLARKARNRYYC